MRYAFPALAIAVLYSCSPISKARLNTTFKATERRFQDQTGFVLFDVERNTTVYDFNGSKYFTPASNTKIFTFFASLKILGDSVPALEYIQHDDSLICWGTGDPSFLYKEVFYDSGIYHFLKSADSKLFFSSSNYFTTPLGSGWAWDDYSFSYSAERSAFPMYGNVVSFIADQNVLKVTPPFFSEGVIRSEGKERTEFVRDQGGNTFRFYPANKFIQVKEFSVPFKTDSSTLLSLLGDTLKRTVKPLRMQLPPLTNILFSLHVDSLYKVMLQQSDNFIAEQLLLMCSNILSDSLKPEIAIDFIKRTYLKDLPDEPVWVDGSGLSRYNLFTPRSLVTLWHKILEIVPQQRLFSLLATGGLNGTIRNWYAADKPYIFGKTGTLSNNHCLSGFLVTRKGKVLIFSFMNSNYTKATAEVRRNMQTILFNIYEHY
jgi:D-alanyl-D-alanine carboxypeptidase/D-alanyl-D-alanine-endopeptidase (penicillin-binding protein 4)